MSQLTIRLPGIDSQSSLGCESCLVAAVYVLDVAVRRRFARIRVERLPHVHEFETQELLRRRLEGRRMLRMYEQTSMPNIPAERLLPMMYGSAGTWLDWWQRLWQVPAAIGTISPSGVVQEDSVGTAESIRHGQPVHQPEPHHPADSQVADV